MRRRSPAIIVAALAPAVLLAVDPGGWYPFGPAKWLAVSALVPAGAAVVLARRPVRVAVAPTALALGLVAWLALAAALGEDGLYAWVGTPERHLGVVAWVLAALALVVGQSLGDDEDRRVVAGGLVVAGLGVGVVATAEALGWEPDVLAVGSRLSGPLGSPAYLGAAAALVLPPVLGVAADPTWGRRARIAAAAVAAGLTVAAVGSGARAAWVGLAAAAAAVGWARRSRFRFAARRGAMRLVAGAGAVAVIGLVVVGPVGARVASTFDAGEPGGRGRLDEWRVAARVVADHPIAGVGPEGYRIAFASGVDAAYERAHGRDPQPDRAHSTPLDLALAGGVPAVAAWLALVVVARRSVAVALRGDRPWLVGIAAGLVAHVVGGLFLFPVVELEPVAWLLAGLLLAAAPATASPWWTGDDRAVADHGRPLVGGRDTLTAGGVPRPADSCGTSCGVGRGTATENAAGSAAGTLAAGAAGPPAEPGAVAAAGGVPQPSDSCGTSCGAERRAATESAAEPAAETAARTAGDDAAGTGARTAGEDAVEPAAETAARTSAGRAARAWTVVWPAPAVVVGGLGLVAALALGAGVADVVADRHARRAADALAAGDGATAADAAHAAVRLRPDEVRLHLLDGRARVADQQGIVAALAAVDDALAVSPGDPIAVRERARLLVARADATRAPAHIDAARAALDRLLARDPVDSTLWALASVAAELDGDHAAADAALARAEELRPERRDGT